ncbi:hypothetical protein [Sphingomonas sp. TREG-RG-20F-R18-01]|uniref:hypothetical protein n=1 Tax=Sphingomonas sp. TREG-RG-20F-R18-01 TaxID=2914982 RepID=UPI001F57EE61|nr:hypothetical protein [Sphingomonas sp. TREG-RG-20F-R18-01]
MTGVDIIGALLGDSGEINSLVATIKAGSLPDGTPLPALLVRLVSSVERQPLVRGGAVRMTDRVSVAVRANSYREQVAIIKAVRNVCAGQLGAIASATEVAVLSAGTGPDVGGPANSFEQTQDFKVGFNALT